MLIGCNLLLVYAVNKEHKRIYKYMKSEDNINGKTSEKQENRKFT